MKLEHFDDWMVMALFGMLSVTIVTKCCVKGQFAPLRK